MFGKLFGSKGGADVPAPRPGPQLCMVALRSPRGLTSGAVLREWQALFPDIPIAVADSKKAQMTFQCGDGTTVIVAGVPTPIPMEELSAVAERSWMWPQAMAELASHKMHLLVTAFDVGAVEQARSVTNAAAAICKVADVAGIYWGNGGQVHAPGLFVSMACGLKVPVPLWIRTMLSAKSPKGPSTFSSFGLPSFGHKEFEVIDTRMPPDDLRDTMCAVIEYVLTNGPVLRHGDSFGPTPQDHWKVEHTTSRFREGDPVIRLHIP